jgi:hypothetical protein
MSGEIMSNQSRPEYSDAFRTVIPMHPYPYRYPSAVSLRPWLVGSWRLNLFLDWRRKWGRR